MLKEGISVKIPTKHIRPGKGSYMSPFPDEDWETINESVCKGFVAIQENCYIVTTRWVVQDPISS